MSAAGGQLYAQCQEGAGRAHHRSLQGGNRMGGNSAGPTASGSQGTNHAYAEVVPGQQTKSGGRQQYRVMGAFGRWESMKQLSERVCLGYSSHWPMCMETVAGRELGPAGAYHVLRAGPSKSVWERLRLASEQLGSGGPLAIWHEQGKEACRGRRPRHFVRGNRPLPQQGPPTWARSGRVATPRLL